LADINLILTRICGPIEASVPSVIRSVRRAADLAPIATRLTSSGNY